MFKLQGHPHPSALLKKTASEMHVASRARISQSLGMLWSALVCLGLGLGLGLGVGDQGMVWA